MPLKKLSDVCEIIMGQSPDSSSYNEYGEGLPFFQGKADFGELYPIPRMYCSKPSKIAITNDILMSVRAPVGDVNIATEECCIGRGVAAIRTKKNIDFKYLYYVLEFMKEKIASLGTGSTFKAISKAPLSSIEILVPPLEQQIKIVNLVDKVKKVINKRQSQITALDELINSYFYETLKDDLKSLSLEDLIISTQNGLSRRGDDEIGEIVLKLKNVKNNKVNFENVNRIALTERELRTYEVNKEDLLVVRVNGNPNYVGRSAVFNGYEEPVYFNDHIIRVKVANVNVNYLSYLLNSNLGISEIQKNIKTSAGQYTISRDGLNKIKLKIPNEIIQNEFIRKKEIINLKKANLEVSLENLETLYSALLQRAFKGELFQE